MKTHLAVMFAVSVWATGASAQTAIPVGAGSYASFPPASAGGTAIATANQSLYVEATNSLPVPSNKWWTDLVINQYAGNLWASPLAVSVDAQGINISRPDFDTIYDGAHSFLGVNFQPELPLSIHGQGFSPADARALSWGDWTLTFRMQQAASFMDVTVGRGLPYTWIQFTGVSPQLVSTSTATYFDDNGNALSFPLTTNHLGISYSNKFYGVFAPDNTQFSLSNSTFSNTINVTFSGSNTYLVVSAMPSRTNLAYFSQYAYVVPTNSTMNWLYDPDGGAVTTSWHLATQAWQGSETNTIQGWIPHHWRNANKFNFNGLQYTVARGLMKCTTGTDFQIVYKFNGILPTLPAPTTLGLANDYSPSRMASYIASVASNTAVGADTYAGGKDLLRYAQHLVFASLMGLPQTNALINTLETTLADWFTYNPTSDDRYFAYYPAWKALTGFPASYESDQFNDHHFHYGYFAHSLALLGMSDQTFLQNYGPMAKLMVKEYANWDRTDPNFPFFRTLDVWEGHSWASGFSDSTKGNNQESSGEAMNSWGGLFLLGAMLGDDQMRSAGAMGWAMESESVRQYYYNVPKFYSVNDSNWPPNYTSTIVGILWGSGQEAQTYFGASADFVHGIQWLPPSPVMQYQVEDPAFAQADYNHMLTEYGNTISSMGAEWGNYALSYAAQFDPDYSAAQMDQLYALNDPVATDVTYAGVTYWQTHSTRKLGTIQWQFHMSVPTSVVYYNTNTAKLSFLAYNPQPTSQVTRVYSNNIDVGFMLLPPHSFVNQSILGTGAVTIVTNVVAADVEPGVVISWPTMVSSNYQPLSAAILTPNTAWTNLTTAIVGDGTSNALFDPFGTSQQKFYRVLQYGPTGGGGGGTLTQILNPGFETAGATASDAANWTVTQAVGGPVSAVRTNDNPHTGSFNFEVHLASTGNGPVVEFGQSGVPVTPGSTNTLSFYAHRLPGSLGDNDQYNVQWFNSNSVLVASTGYLNFNAATDAYSQTVIGNLVAPATAASVTVLFHCAGAAIPSQSATIQFDDVSLTNCLSGGGGGGGTTNEVQTAINLGASITWFASNTVPYQVQYATDLINSNWTNLGSVITGTGASNTVYDASLLGLRKIYQVLSIQ